MTIGSAPWLQDRALELGLQRGKGRVLHGKKCMSMCPWNILEGEKESVPTGRIDWEINQVQGEL